VTLQTKATLASAKKLVRTFSAVWSDTDPSGPLLVGIAVSNGGSKEWEILTLPVSSSERDPRLDALAKELQR